MNEFAVTDDLIGHKKGNFGVISGIDGKRDDHYRVVVGSSMKVLDEESVFGYFSIGNVIRANEIDRHLVAGWKALGTSGAFYYSGMSDAIVIAIETQNFSD